MSESPALLKPHEEPSEKPSEIPTGVLYNRCYGGFGFSNECKEVFKARTGETVGYEEGLRSHPAMIALFHEKGSEWMSGRFAKLGFHEVPEALLEFVHVGEYDGNETVGLHTEGAKSKYLDEFRKSVNAEQTNLHEAYAILCAKLDALKAANREYYAMQERRNAKRREFD